MFLKHWISGLFLPTFNYTEIELSFCHSAFVSVSPSIVFFPSLQSFPVTISLFEKVGVLPPVRQPCRRALSPDTLARPNRSPPTTSTPGHHHTHYIASNTQTHLVSPLPQRSSPLLSQLPHLSTCMVFTLHT